MIKIMFTLEEGSYWIPIFLSNLGIKNLLSGLPKGNDTSIIREGTLTALKNAKISSVILPNKIRTKSIIFHSLMLESGLVFDSTFAYLGKDKGWDNRRYTEEDFKGLWKLQGKKQHDKWLKKLADKREENK